MDSQREIPHRRINPFFLAIAASLLVAFSSATPVYAIDNPDTISIETVRAYDSVLTSGDLLIIVQYNLAYSVLPDEVITDAFIGRFKRDTIELNSVEPFSFNDQGYGRGVFSLFWTPAQKAADSIEFNNPNLENYTLTLQGDIGVFTGSVPTTTTDSITYRDATDTSNQLFADVKALAQKFENDSGWNDDPAFASLITTGGGVDQLTSVGEEYFSNAMPNLNVMIPSIFSSGKTSADFVPRASNRSFEGELNTFWDSTTIDDGFDSLAEDTEAPRLLWTTMVALFFMGVIAFVMGKWLKDTGLGIAFGLLTTAVTLPMATAVNLVPLNLTVVIAFLAVVGIGWTLFARRAGS